MREWLPSVPSDAMGFEMTGNWTPAAERIVHMSARDVLLGTTTCFGALNLHNRGACASKEVGDVLPVA